MGASRDSRGLVVAARACLESYTAAMAEGEGPASNLFNGEAVVGDWVELEVGDDHWVDMPARMLCRQRRPRSVEDPLVRQAVGRCWRTVLYSSGQGGGSTEAHGDIAHASPAEGAVGGGGGLGGPSCLPGIVA